MEKEKNRLIAEIYQNHVNAIYRFIFFKVGQKERAEDLTSDVFFRFFDNLDKFLTKEVDPIRWLFGIAHKVILENYRQDLQLISLERVEADLPEETESIDAKLITAELIAAVREHLRELKEPAQSIIKLKIWEEYSFQEISEILSLGLSQVKMQYYRGLEEIKKKMNKNDRKFRAIAWPLLLVAIREVGQSSDLQISARSQSSIQKSLEARLSDNFKKFNKMKNINKKVLAAVAAVVLVLSVIAGIAFSSLKPANEVTITPNSAPVIASAPVSTPVEATPAPSPVAEPAPATVETKSFTFRVGAKSIGQKEVTVVAKSDTKVTAQAGGTEQKLVSKDYQLLFANVGEGKVSTVKSYLKLFTNSKFGNIYRVVTTDGIVSYTNEVFTKQSDCNKFAMPGQEVKTPCSTRSVEGVYIIFQKGDIKSADEVVKSMSF